MKKIIFIFLFLLTGTLTANCANTFSAGVRKDAFFDYMESLNLTSAQRAQISSIKKEEEDILMPFMLDIQSKERGLEFLQTLGCDMRDFDCKKRLKQDIIDREFEIRELTRQIVQKKSYYKIRYKNVLNREQNTKLQKLIEENEHKDKVLMERELKAKRKQRIDNLKVWRKIPDIKEKIFKK